MIKAIIFDSDDTIVDFSSIAAGCIQKAASNLKLKVPKRQEINKLWGRSIEYIIDNLWGREHIHEFRKEYFKMASRYKFKEIKGAKATINLLKKKYKLGVISAKPRPLMIKNFKDINLDTKIFKFMLSADDTRFHKPDPRVFEGVLAKLKIKSHEVLYVGDMLVDCEASRKAGFNFAAVLTGFYKKKDFIKMGLEKENILNSIKELPKLVEKLG